MVGRLHDGGVSSDSGILGLFTSSSVDEVIDRMSGVFDVDSGLCVTAGVAASLNVRCSGLVNGTMLRVLP